MEPIDVEASSDPDKDNGFFFESDHLALKGNEDYKTLLKTVIILEAQRSQALADLDELMSCRLKACKDPIAYVTRFQNGDLPKYPAAQKIAQVPCIDLWKYNTGDSDMKSRPQTRHGNIMPQIRTRKHETDNGKILVRGRAFDDSKPETFNQLWTKEEQIRLQELLIEFPPEEVEMRRWIKIANRLGNRTPKQVSSRVQKYFIWLQRNGLPVPGRAPKVKVDIKRNISRHHKRNTFHSSKGSTFFPHQDIEFSGNDESREQPIQEEFVGSIFEDNSGNENEEDNPELRQIDLLRRIKTQKEDNQSSTYQHLGFKCFVCKEDPLRGTRWHCSDCPDGTDLCGDCVVAQLESENPTHNVLHKLVPILVPDYPKNYDFDYCPHIFTNTSYNYLDPNFLPE